MHGIMVNAQQLHPPALTARNRTIGLQLAVDVPAHIQLKLSWTVLVLMQPSTWMKPMGKFYGSVHCRQWLHHMVINGGSLSCNQEGK